MLSIKKTLIITIVSLLLVTGSWFGFTLWSFLNTPLIAEEGEAATFLFAQGTSVKKMAYSLAERNLLKHPLYLVLFVRLDNAEFNLKAGEYVIEPGTTPRQLVEKMVKGDMLHHAFTIVEGWTFQKIVAALNSNQYVIHTMQGLDAPKIMEKLGHAGEHPEGRFAPDTYVFSGKVTDVDILFDAYQLMQKQLKSAWDSRAKDLLYHCSYEALIAASLIEKETAIGQEKVMIADIILRRLIKGMPLQIDPTVIYGLGPKFSGKLSRADLAKNTPYNTYVHKGLPPTPISMPGKDSLNAALHPAANSFWYYVAKGDGTHKFSDTLKEQGSAIKKYLLRK